jgi:NodT family efflux transporter outer membrane factor (OMF) lipoprotein
MDINSRFITKRVFSGKMGILLLAVIGGLVSSCMVGPNYVRPKVVVPPKFKEVKAHKVWQPISPRDLEARGPWWTTFNDPILNRLEDQLNLYNQNIKQAEANYRQALAIVDQARSNLFPTVLGAASLYRQKQGGGTTSFISSTDGNTTTNIANSNTILTRAPTITVYSTVLNAAWEPDIWGLVRRTIEANLATAQSNAALVAVTRLSAQSSLAQYYFELRTLDADQALLVETVRANKKLLQLTQHQYNSGVASRADIVQAQTEVETVQAQAINNGILRGQYEHAIAVLIGRPPAYLSIKGKPYTFKVPNIPVEIPSVWLERRPDIAQAERLVQTASASIGVAVAAYYPSLTLTGTTTASGRSLHRLIHTPILGWSTGMQLAQTVFDGGLRKATVRAAKDAYISQVAAYRQTVLTAFQDVEDNLIALRLLSQQSTVQQQAAVHAREALRLMVNQYKAGTVPFANVVTAQIAAYTATKTANDVKGLQMTAAVGLIKALGGGWVR